MKDFRELKVWQKSHQLTLDIYNDLNLLEPTHYQQLHSDVTEIKRMLTAFIQKLKADR